MTEEELANSLRPRDSGASFAATKYQSLARVEPLTEDADAWLRAYAGGETSWDGRALVVEMRYFPRLADAAIADGHTFETDASAH